MDNNKNTAQTEDKKSLSGKQKALIALGVGVMIVSGLVYAFRNNFSPTAMGDQPTQDSFQGPAELSTTAQVSCQESATKVMDTADCTAKESEFFANGNNCLNVYVVAEKDSENFEGNYGDLSLRIAQCYQARGSTEQAKNLLEKVASQFSWDVNMGPVSCDSASTLAAYIESYSIVHDFKCVKKDETQIIVNELKNKNFGFIKNLIAANQIVHQGFIDSDVSCPETFVSLTKKLETVTSKGFDVPNPKMDPGAPDDVFIEIFRGPSRALILQFKEKDGCLNFDALLEPSEQVE